MFKLGGIMFVLGVLSFGLKYFGREFIVLLWIDLWGPTIATVIRIALIVLGLILMGIGYSEVEVLTDDDVD